MKNRKYLWKKRAILGITAGLILAGPSSMVASDDSDPDKNSSEANDGNLGYHLYTEEELLLELNPEGTKLYKSLSPEGKALALRVASQRCNGTNECSGLNACKTEANDCAGKGKCAGRSKCSIGDKNLVVRLVAKKMAEKRAKAQGSSQ